MKNHILFIVLLLVFPIDLRAQITINKKWDFRFGGSNADNLTSIINVESNFLLTGWSNSDSSGDKTQNNWLDSNNNVRHDYWCVLIDSVGNKIWDKRYGGTLEEFQPIAAFNPNNNSLLIAGTSFSDSSGDKSQDAWKKTIYPSRDFWAINVSSSGNKLWDRRYGGTTDEYPFSVVYTSTGNYLISGYSNSDSSGDKSQNNQSTGYADYWIILVDSSGNKIWDKRFGGYEHEFLTSSIETSDGGFLLGGFSRSDMNGDKSQPIWGTVGTPDYWIVKIDINGNKQWDKRFGGIADDKLFSILQTSDGGYVLGGTSYSDISGDKSQPSWGIADYWLVKTDSLGNKIWDKRFGGINNEDEFGNINLSIDGNIYVCGLSYSNITGDKSEVNLGQEQVWILKIDLLGNKIWDKTIFTNEHEEFGRIVSIDSSCFLVAVETKADTGGYITQVSRGNLDYWVVKFCESTITSGDNDNLNSNLQLTVSPNPFLSDISISIQSSNLKQISFRIRNILGQTLYYKQEMDIGNNYTKMLDLNLLANGVYFLQIEADGIQTTKKIIKQ